MTFVLKFEKGTNMTETALGPDGKEYPTGDLEPLVDCRGCHQLKPISDFHFSAREDDRHYRNRYCKVCRAESGQAYRDARRKPDPRQVRMAERRARAVELYNQNWSYPAIAAELGVVPSTVARDLQAMGASGVRRNHVETTASAPDKPNVTVADNVIRQLTDMARLVHDGTRVVLQLEGLTVPPEMAAEWEKNLAHVGKALRYLRSHAKKGNT